MSNFKEIEFNLEFGKRLATVRGFRKLSQTVLGAHIGVSAQQIYKYESGENTMNPERIKKCAQVLKVPVAYFYGEDEFELHRANFDKDILTGARELHRMRPNLRQCFFNFMRDVNDLETIAQNEEVA